MAAGEIKVQPVYETDQLFVIPDIQPQAPVHLLVIPKRHLKSVLDFSANDVTLLLDLTLAIQHVAKSHQLDTRGLRVVTNVGQEGGQSVNHIHFHVLGGRQMHWPPG